MLTPDELICQIGLRAAAEKLGRSDFTPLWCGQNPLCPNQPAAEITRWLAQGFTA